uniref:Centriolar and ciliogenesis-associated protein HYLS1 C-terminal domain-containing protein n=1 Tax=Timema genevievae TaxID=629358 RepID=A0A7R9JVB2_TIMGE|nr:unnamed protein product [Timema genevievae]
MSIVLDPREVLAHLQQLGYHNISPEQLQEFIKDLKKLIKFDQRQRDQCSCHNEIESRSSSATVISDFSLSGQSQENVRRVKSALADSDQNIIRPCSVTSSSNNLKKDSHKDSQTKSRPSRTKKARSKSVERMDHVSKPRSSAFIRPWQLTQGQPGVTRCDPVALYHWYQAAWRKQKLPGEDNHSNLRWDIRKKMLGEHPFPRPMSQSSSMDMLYRRSPRF